jgi:hypothetical protein
VLEAITAFHTNLNPASAGDVDLGAGDGQPLTDRAVGQNVDVAVRVNTGGLYLGTFDLYVYFDPTVLSIQDPKTAVTFNPNKKQIGSGILDAVVEGGSLHFSGSIDTTSLRNAAALLVTIRFNAIGAGTTQLSGHVELLGSTSLPPVDIGTRGAPFVSGTVYQTVTGTSRSRKHALSSRELVGHGQSQQQQQIAEAAARHGRSRFARATALSRSGRCVQEVGDTNADCVFDVNDERFVTQFLAYRGINFAGGDGPVVQAIVASWKPPTPALS